MKILIIGSINTDLVYFVNRFPEIGETLQSNLFERHHGGKGANQAISALKLSDKKRSNEISLFAKYGKDLQGKLEWESLSKNYNGAKLNTKYIFESKKSTGSAVIINSKMSNNNQIIIHDGANGDFSEKDLNNLEKAIGENDIIALQLETNEWLVEKSLELAKLNNKITVLNPSPTNNFKNKWLKNIDWLIPNEIELALLSNHSVENLDDIENACKILANIGAKNIIVTLGRNGVYIFSNEKNIYEHVRTKPVDSIDATGAGDTFLGSFLSHFEFKNLKDNIKFAMKAASMSVLKKGAQSSIPYFNEVNKKEGSFKNDK